MVGKTRLSVGAHMVGAGNRKDRKGEPGDGLRGAVEFGERPATRSLRIEGGPLERWLYKRRKRSIDSQLRATIALTHGGDIWSDWLETGVINLWVPELTEIAPLEVWAQIITRRLYVGARRAPTDSAMIMRYAIEPKGDHSYRVKLDLGELNRDLIEMVRRKLEPGWGP
jgi:hypothetical protein